MTLKSRLVGVTDGLGTCRTLSWTGSRNTAPETPTGAVTVEMTSAAVNPSASCAPDTSKPYRAAPVCSRGHAHRRTWCGQSVGKRGPYEQMPDGASKAPVANTSRAGTAARECVAWVSHSRSRQGDVHDSA